VLNLKKCILGVVIGSGVLTISMPAVADKIVFDPTNFARNTVTAAQSVKTTSELVLQRKTMLDQYLTMLQNVKNLPSSQVSSVVKRGVAQNLITGNGYSTTDADAAYNEASGVYANYNQLHDTMGSLASAYQSLDAYNTKMNRLSVDSGLTWDTLLASELKAAKAGQVASTQQYQTLQNLTSQIGNFQSRADMLANQIPQNNGALEALSTLSAQNHLLTDQMSGLLQSSIAQAQVATINQREAEVQKERVIDINSTASSTQKEIMNYMGLKKSSASNK